MTLVRTWAGDGRGEEGEAETLSLGRHREWAGCREVWSKSRQACLGTGSNRNRQMASQTPFAKEELRKELRGHKTEQVVAGSCLIQGSGDPHGPGGG